LNHSKAHNPGVGLNCFILDLCGTLLSPDLSGRSGSVGVEFIALRMEDGSGNLYDCTIIEISGLLTNKDGGRSFEIEQAGFFGGGQGSFDHGVGASKQKVIFIG
jgi:hypothetical protein